MPILESIQPCTWIMFFLYGATERELLHSFERTQQHLIQAKLRYKPRKSQLFPVTVPYYGHILGHGEIRPHTGKLKKIRDWPFSCYGIKVLAYLELCGYYRRFIQKCACIDEPLYKISQSAQVSYNDELQKAFQELKDYLCSAITLQLPNLVASFILETDAILSPLGAVLIQHDVRNGEERPMLYHSQTLNGPKRR